MKKIFFPLLALLLVTMAGCSEKFNVAAPYKNITVVYGFLKSSDTAHYIRVQKAFLDENKNAFTMAKEPDSNFYNNIKVTIKMYRASDPPNPRILNEIILNRVNLDQEGYPKQPGVFFESPNYAYKFTDRLDSTAFYRIFVTNLTTGNVDSADAPVIAEKGNFSVKMLDIDAINNDGLSFYSVLPNKTVTLDGAYIAPAMPAGAKYLFNGLNNPAAVAQAFVRFNWADSNAGSGTKEFHYYDFDAGYLGTISGGFKYTINNSELYNALRVGMGPAPANVIRLLDRCDLIFYLSTSDFYTYYQVSQVQGTGITGSEIQPVFTNVKGANALGLFTAKAMKTGKITITPRTVDSLMVSPILTQMNIKGTVY